MEIQDRSLVWSWTCLSHWANSMFSIMFGISERNAIETMLVWILTFYLCICSCFKSRVCEWVSEGVSEGVSVCVCAPAAVAEASESEELTVNCSSLVLAESEDGVRKLRSSFSITLELPHMEPVQTRRKRLYLAPSGCYSDSASSAVGVRTNLLVSVGFHFTG